MHAGGALYPSAAVEVNRPPQQHQQRAELCTPAPHEYKDETSVVSFLGPVTLVTNCSGMGNSMMSPSSPAWSGMVTFISEDFEDTTSAPIDSFERMMPTPLHLSMAKELTV